MTESNKPLSPLRRRMIEDMTLRKLSPKTQTQYIRAVRNLAEYLGRSPDTEKWTPIFRQGFKCFLPVLVG